MQISELLTRSCTIIRRTASGTEDDYGNRARDVAEVETTCEVQENRREERPGAGEVSDSQWLGFFLPGTEMDTGDAVRVDGLGTFELVGEPWEARDPETDLEDHIEATLRKTAGAEQGS